VPKPLKKSSHAAKGKVQELSQLVVSSCFFRPNSPTP
jgi:hypothetical protein